MNSGPIKHSKKKTQKFVTKGGTWGEKLLLLKKHFVIVLLLACFSFASGAQATSWLLAQFGKMYHDKVVWKAEEEKLLNSISPNMQVNYVRKMLGEPIFQDGGEVYKEYTFKRKVGWIQIVADKHDRIQLYAISICDKNFRPQVKLPEGRSVRLMSDTLAEKGQGQPYYFLSGATANSYLMEGGYGGNPSNYQSVYVGAADGCGSLYMAGDGSGYYDLLIEKCKKVKSTFAVADMTCDYDTKDPEITRMRKHSIINTTVVTAPHVDLPDLGPRPQFGPDRIMLRVLPGYYD